MLVALASYRTVHFDRNHVLALAEVCARARIRTRVCVCACMRARARVLDENAFDVIASDNTALQGR